MTRFFLPLIFIGLIAAGAWVYYSGHYAGSSRYIFARAERRTISHEAQASGTVEPLTKLDLHFKNSGRLVALSAQTGKYVSAGDVLARQDASTLAAQQTGAIAALAAASASLAKIKAGASPESVQVAETSVAAANQSLADSKRSLVDTINSAYTVADDAVHNKADSAFSNPTTNPQLVFSVINPQYKSALEGSRAALEPMLASWQASLGSLSLLSDLASYTSHATSDLNQVKSFLDTLALAVNTSAVNVPASTLSTWQSNIALARTNVAAAIASLTAAASKAEDAETALAIAESQLSLTKAPPRAADIDLADAQVAQAQAGVDQIQAELADTTLIAPASGVVTDTHGHVGETIGPDTIIASIIPGSVLEIKANISEDNIVDVVVGQQARIELDAFGDSAWSGRVVAIDPAETEIGGAVYYQATIIADTADTRVRPGMTATVWVRTASKDNVLALPVSALIVKNSKKYIDVLQSGQILERNVTTGLEASDGMVEIVSGISDGEQAVIGIQ